MSIRFFQHPARLLIRTKAIAENETNGKGLVLFLVPSIALLGQTLRSWCQQAASPIHAVCICSDSQASKQEIKNDDSSTSVLDLALPASTDTNYIVLEIIKSLPKVNFEE